MGGGVSSAAKNDGYVFGTEVKPADVAVEATCAVARFTRFAQRKGGGSSRSSMRRSNTERGLAGRVYAYPCVTCTPMHGYIIVVIAVIVIVIVRRSRPRRRSSAAAADTIKRASAQARSIRRVSDDLKLWKSSALVCGAARSEDIIRRWRRWWRWRQWRQIAAAAVAAAAAAAAAVAVAVAGTAAVLTWSRHSETACAKGGASHSGGRVPPAAPTPTSYDHGPRTALGTSRWESWRATSSR